MAVAGLIMLRNKNHFKAAGRVSHNLFALHRCYLHKQLDLETALLTVGILTEFHSGLWLYVNHENFCVE